MALLSYKLPYRKRCNVASHIPMPSVLPWSADVKLARSHLRWRYRYPVMCKSATRLSSRTTWTPMIKLRRQPMLTDVHRLRAENLHLYGLLANWTEIEDSTWVAQLLDWEEGERARRSL